MNKSWQISRRSMLKGVGACIALPFLEAMIPSSVLASPSPAGPKRVAFLFAPNGVCPGRWSPKGLGSNFELSPILAPLAGLEQHILVLQQLMNKWSTFGVEGHYTKTGNFLTSMEITRTIGANVNTGGPSIDQLIARKLGQETIIPSLVYGVDRLKSGVCTSTGITKLYGSYISWETATRPAAKEINPRFAFDRMFRNVVPGRKARPASPLKGSILDAVMEDANSLQKKLGIADQNKLAEYLASIRSVEMRLQNQAQLRDFESGISPDIKKELQRLDIRIEEYIDLEAGIDITEKVRLMLDIMVLAFWSDASRVGTFMFGNAASGRNFSFLEGVRGSFHSISHHQDDPRRMKQYELINRWHIEQVAYFLNRLQSIPEGDGSLLDHSMVLFGSGLRNGNKHAEENLPIILAGGGGGRIRSGQHLTFPENTPLANLYLTMAQVMGIQLRGFADASGTLPEIVC
ncbi:MAG: DUF1552 domain-containing protein [Bacteroidetes bacterium]|nr:MAG: DUF1552 domain-containing protein [Bacteroidota bacterium]